MGGASEIINFQFTEIFIFAKSLRAFSIGHPDIANFPKWQRLVKIHAFLFKCVCF